MVEFNCQRLRVAHEPPSYIYPLVRSRVILLIRFGCVVFDAEKTRHLTQAADSLWRAALVSTENLSRLMTLLPLVLGR